MRALIAMVFATGLSAASLGAVAAPEATYAVKLLTPEAALTAAQAAMAHCRKAGHQVTVAVVDRSGQIRAQLRADNAGPHTNDTSRRKAYMSATMRANSGTIAENVAKNPGAAGVAQITDFIMLAGGVPIRSGNEVIGAIGVGGAPGGNLDEACANAGIDKIKDRLN